MQLLSEPPASPPHGRPALDALSASGLRRASGTPDSKRDLRINPGCGIASIAGDCNYPSPRAPSELEHNHPVSEAPTVQTLGSRAAAARMGKTAKANLMSMFMGSDNPEEMQKLLVDVAQTDSKLTFAMLRSGWERTLAVRRERAASEGLVGALIFSVTLQMVVTPLGYLCEEAYPCPEDSDFWTPYRPRFRDLYHVMICLGSTCSAIAVVTSCLYMLWIQIYVSDADDFVWFTRNYRVGVWVDTPMVAALLLSVLSVAFGTVCIYRERVATICFVSVWGLVAASAAMFFLGVIPAERRSKENFGAMSGKYTHWIREAYLQAIAEPSAQGSPASRASTPSCVALDVGAG